MRVNFRSPRATGFSLLFLAALPGLAAAQPKLPQAPNLTPHTLTVSKRGSGAGQVQSVPLVGTTGAPLGIDCGTKCTNNYSAGVPVTLRAIPGTGVFAGWSGDCSGTARCELSMTGAKNVTALFELPKVKVIKNGEMRTATVRSDYSGPGGPIDCGGNCTITVPRGTRLALTTTGLRAGFVPTYGSRRSASPPPEGVFSLDGASQPFQTIEMDALASVQLTVSTPKMTVTSTPAGLATKGTGDFAYPFPAGTNLRLKADSLALWYCKNDGATVPLVNFNQFPVVEVTFPVPPDRIVRCTVRLP